MYYKINPHSGLGPLLEPAKHEYKLKFENARDCTKMSFYYLNKQSEIVIYCSKENRDRLTFFRKIEIQIENITTYYYLKYSQNNLVPTIENSTVRTVF